MKCFTRAALCMLNGDASLRILSTNTSGCFFINVTFTAVAEISIRGDFFFKSYHKFIEFNLFFIHLILFWIDELIHLYSIYLSSMNIEFHLWYENYRRHFQIYLQWKCLNSNYNRWLPGYAPALPTWQVTASSRVLFFWVTRCCPGQQAPVDKSDKQASIQTRKQWAAVTHRPCFSI